MGVLQVAKGDRLTPHEVTMLPFLFLYATSALALQAPAGWTPQGEDRALLDPSNPTKGELREYVVPNGTGIADELVRTLSAKGVQASIVSERNGMITLQTNDSRVIQARASVAEGKAKWYLVLASPEATKSLDANALLTSLQARIPVNLAWGGEIEVLAGGGDGSLWGTAGASKPSWSVGDREPEWLVDASLYGFWRGQLETVNGYIDVKLRLDANGRVRMERISTDGRMNVSEGTWGTHDEELRLAWYASEPLVTSYRLGKQTLILTLDDRTVEMQRKE